MPEPLSERMRLDSFTRQVLVAGVSTIEAALSDYGLFVEAFAAHWNPQVEVADATKGGVTTRLRRFASVWPLAFGRESQELPEPALDMLALIQVRNRLVHHDGRPSAWHAMALDLKWIAQEYKLTTRVQPYRNYAAYGLDHTHIGMEYMFGVFALDTVLATIDALHFTVYPEQVRAAWMRVPRTKDGRLDIDAAPKREAMLLFDR